MKYTNTFAQAFAALLIVATSTTSASADWDWDHFWHGLHVGFYRNNAWPDPFNEVDAANVIQPFEVMKANGWRMHNTIGHELFRAGDGALLAAGHKRVHWIASQAPASRRTVYVLTGRSDDETQRRVAAVHQTLANAYFPGPAPTVLVTNVEPATSSGAWATKINREWLEHLTAPQLPSVSASGNVGAATQSTGP